MKQNKLREYRQAAGLSQVALGQRASIAPQSLSSIECGRLAPWPKARKALAKALKVPEAELFPEVGSNGKPDRTPSL